MCSIHPTHLSSGCTVRIVGLVPVIKQTNYFIYLFCFYDSTIDRVSKTVFDRESLNLMNNINTLKQKLNSSNYTNVVIKSEVE